MSDEARRALERTADLWRRERQAARDRAAAERRETPFRERVRRGVALRDLAIADADPAPGERTLLWLESRRPGEVAAARLGPGDPVILWREDPEEREAVRGTVARRRGDKLGVMVGGDPPERLEEAPFRLDRDDDEATFDRGDRALERARRADPGSHLARLREVLAGAAAPDFGPEAEWTPRDEGLNAPQRAAVARALAARDVALIHGPPGTGKTRTLVEVVVQAVRRGERVLATAASNAAVDNLGERAVAAGLDVVRLGHPARVSPAMESRSIDALMAASEEAAMAREWIAEAHRLRQQLQKRWAKRRITWQERRTEQQEVNRLFRDARVSLRRIQEGLLERSPVVCATAAGADGALLGDQAFDLVVLDEATQATDPIALVAVARGARVVMAGDPCQLPPTVVDPKAAREGLGRTFFERLADAGRGDPLRLLVVQHRMHAVLQAFPSRETYGGALEAHPTVADHVLEELGVAPDPLRPGPLVFVDAAGKGWEEERAPDDPSTRNPEQGRRVAAEVERLLGRGLAPADLAVITPYDAQVRLLRGLLAGPVARGLEVGSVDGFQGREKEAVVVDLVRSNDAGEVGFLRDVRRMNVALTRARRFLLVVGDSATLGGHPYYAAFMAAAEEAGGYLSAWADEAPPFGEG